MLAKGFRFSRCVHWHFCYVLKSSKMIILFHAIYFQYSQTFVCVLGICYFIEIEGDFSHTTALTKVVRLVKYNNILICSKQSIEPNYEYHILNCEL